MHILVSNGYDIPELRSSHLMVSSPDSEDPDVMILLSDARAIEHDTFQCTGTLRKRRAQVYMNQIIFLGEEQHWQGSLAPPDSYGSPSPKRHRLMDHSLGMQSEEETISTIESST
jgi:hypothetical protein